MKFPIEVLQVKKNILFFIVDQLKKDTEIDPEYRQHQLQVRSEEVEQLDKAIKLLEIADS